MNKKKKPTTKLPSSLRNKNNNGEKKEHCTMTVGMLKQSLETCQLFSQKQAAAWESLYKSIHNNCELSEENLTIKNNRIMVIHRCVFPGCKKTFTSSGWFKAHLKTHVKDLKNDKNILLFNELIHNNLLPPEEME